MNVRKWMRDLHLYTGLFLCPFVLIFAVSTILLNHTWLPWDGGPDDTVVEMSLGESMPADLEKLDQARWILEHTGISGEIQSIQYRGSSIIVPVGIPGEQISISLDTESQTASIYRKTTGLWDRLIYLHKTPGPHLAGFRGNWIFVKIWRALVDASVALILFSTASGIYLWILIRAQRRTGLVLLGSGALTFVLLVAALAG